MEWLLSWAYAREKVHLARMPGLQDMAGFAPRGWAKASNSERIGAAVGSSMNLGFEAPADAYAVMAAVEATGRTARLLREYALMGSCARPDWTPHPVVRYERDGVMTGLDARKRRRVILSCIRWTGDLPQIVAERRRVYGEWARGVRAVHAALSRGALVAHALTDDLPSLAPWGA